MLLYCLICLTAVLLAFVKLTKATRFIRRSSSSFINMNYSCRRLFRKRVSYCGKLLCCFTKINVGVNTINNNNTRSTSSTVVFRDNFSVGGRPYDTARRTSLLDPLSPRSVPDAVRRASLLHPAAHITLMIPETNIEPVKFI